MTTTHVAPEEVMAWVDGELAEHEALAVAEHVEECAECAGVAAGFRRMSEEMAEWRVEEVPARVEASVMKAAEDRGRSPHISKSRYGAPGIRRRWVVGLGCAAVLVLVLVSMPTFLEQKKLAPSYMVAPTLPQPSAMPMEQRAPVGIAGLAEASTATADAPPQLADKQFRGGGAPLAATLAAPSPAAPMIARTVELTVRVKEAGAARAALEAVVARHHGYMAQMTASSAEGTAHEFQASLRIPAAELAAALREIRTLGLVENETQSGEEVTQQHQDLVARLKNSRETETRLQAILEQRTGRISDVLEVEQEIARVRGEIESMEAEQTGLEHRVDFASVDLSLVEQYKAQFGGPADSVGTRLRNSSVTGFRNAGETVLGIVLFFEEYGPTLLVWGMLLALPGIWVWRRYRRMMRVG